MQRARYQTIVQLGLPVVGGMVSQNVLNLVDTSMVGSLGDAALAAVGTGSFLNFMAMAFVMGLSAGVQAIVSRRVGEGRSDTTAPLNGALLLSACFSVPIFLLVFFAAPSLFSLLNPDANVVELGVPYLRIRLCVVAFVGMNFSFRGYWNAVKNPKIYMRTLIVMHILNIGLNWVFIYGHLGMPALGCNGAALATAIATVCGTGLYAFQARRLAPGFLAKLPSSAQLRSILRLSTPNGLQQLLFASGYTVLFGIIGRVGTAETAAANVLINLMLVCILPGMAIGIAGASLVGQSLGRGDPADAKQWGWDVTVVGMVAMGLCGVPMVLFPEWVLHFFLHGRDTIDLAKLPLQLMGGLVAVDAIGMVLMNAMIGAGATRTSAFVVVGLQWFVYLPGAYLVGPTLGYGLLGIWSLQVAYRAIQSATFAWLWHRGGWQKSAV